ncbi:MAG TPA: 50S ribosomal protein L28 [Dehalococcoidia bacterium]|jgi:large subunit ribosomal protein L28|nr:50S ribosomal protein L28 [Dehalococcoidia bacterium]
MAKCELTGKIPQSGNNVSHAKNRNKRKFKPNLQKVSFWSSKLNKKISITAATSAIRDIDKAGSFDVYLIKTNNSYLSNKLKKVQKEIISNS